MQYRTEQNRKSPFTSIILYDPSSKGVTKGGLNIYVYIYIQYP